MGPTLASMIVLFIPVVAIALIGIVALMQGIRMMDEPTCRGCGQSLKQFGATPKECSGCGRPLTRPRDVRFHGRRRPAGLWIIATLLCVPAALSIALVVALSMEWVTERTFTSMHGITPIVGNRMSHAQARALDDDELITALVNAPYGPDGWGELLERIKQENTSEETLIQVMSLLDTVVQKMNSDPLYSPGSFELSATMLQAIDKLGYGHPRVQSFLMTNIKAPENCPRVVDYGNGMMFTFSIDPTTTTTNDALTWLLQQSWSSLDVQPVLTGIRIDGVDYPEVGADGTQNWQKKIPHLNIRWDKLPEQSATPGEHKMELDILSIVAPRFMYDSVDPEDWPTNLVRNAATLECTYVVPETNAE